jgi:ubiquinone/menaquinone biosynthesis C-methylase UbiE
MVESTVQHWDALWEQHKDEPVHLRELERIIALTAARGADLRGKKVLEVGAGSAIDSIMLAKRTGCSAHCVDYSAKAIQFMKRNFRNAKLKGVFVKADIKRIPVNQGTYDVIFSNGVLEHFRDPMPIIREQKRVLKRGGLLVIGVPETYSLYTIKKHWLMRRGAWFAGWETQYSARELRRLARAAGLTVIETRIYGNAPLSFPPWLQRTCTTLHLNRWLASDVVVYCTK